jgi:hypothetical protein
MPDWLIFLICILGFAAGAAGGALMAVNPSLSVKLMYRRNSRIGAQLQERFRLDPRATSWRVAGIIMAIACCYVVLSMILDWIR